MARGYQELFNDVFIILEFLLVWKLCSVEQLHLIGVYTLVSLEQCSPGEGKWSHTDTCKIWQMCAMSKLYLIDEALNIINHAQLR